MSKLCDVRSMYGQDLGIGVTNATTSTLLQYQKLAKNMLLISSPADDEGNDFGMPALFATDYNGNPLQLTYAIYTKNGLYPNSEGYLQMNIDGKTIKEFNKQLYVDTNNLSYCSFNNLGVAKVSRSVTSRTDSTYPTDTFINVDKNGVLYVSDSFIKHMYDYIADRIYKNLYPLIMDNVKGWLINMDDSIHYYPTDRLSILPIDESNGFVITKSYTLEYNSLNGVSEEVSIDINNNDYPIKEVIFNNNTTTVTEDAQSTKEIKIYKHSIRFTIVFYPNYNLQNNIFLDNQYFIKFQPQSFENNQMLMFYFNQNNAFDRDSNELYLPFKIKSTPINLNQLRYNRNFVFTFENNYRYFEDINYNLQILYIKSDNENNIDDAIPLIDENINSLIEENFSSIDIELKSINNDLESTTYKTWKNCLIDVNENTGVITKLADSSSLYKYILTYTINGERSYVYENTFRVNYKLTNIYRDTNYLQLSNTTGLTIYQVERNNGSGDSTVYITAASLMNKNENDFKFVDYEQIENNIILKPRTNNPEFIYKIFESLFESGTLHDGDSDENTMYNPKDILGENAEKDSSEKYKNKVGFLLVYDCNYVNEIFITNGGEDNNQEEYVIYNSITGTTPGEIPDNGNTSLPIITHEDENISLPRYAQYHTLVYPQRKFIYTNQKSLQILSFINLDEFMMQNSSNRTHKKTTSTLWHNFAVYNAQGPTCYVKFGLDYGTFFNDHIKIFDITYGRWEDPFNPGTGSNRWISGNVALSEITSNGTYSNSRFYVGIQEDLFRIFKAGTVSVESNYKRIKGGENQPSQIPISVSMDSYQCFKPEDDTTHSNNTANNGKRYYLFEINYINDWYSPMTENGETVLGPDGLPKYKLDVDIISFSDTIKIKYQWPVQQGYGSENEIPYNIFEYELPFKIQVSSTDPEIVDRIG